MSGLMMQPGTGWLRLKMLIGAVSRLGVEMVKVKMMIGARRGTNLLQEWGPSLRLDLCC